MVKKTLALILVLGALMLVTGCWDRIEINERNFVVGVAIDVPEKSKNLYEVTYQVVIPSGMKLSGGSGNSDGGGKKAFYNMTTQERTMSSVMAKTAAKSSRTPSLEHLKVIIISEAVGKKKGAFADILDFFIRDSETRRSVKLMVASGKARDILSVNPPIENLPSLFINSVAENKRKTSRILPQSKLGDVNEELLKQQSFVIQRITPADKRQDLSVTGAGVFAGNTNRFAGFLNGVETAGLNFIRGDIDGGVIIAKHKEEEIGYEIERARRTFSLVNRNSGNLTFKVDIECEGALSETYTLLELDEEKVISQLERDVAHEIERQAQQAIRKLQKDYKLDVLGLLGYLYRKHYPVWQEVQDDWEKGEKLFTKATIEVEANVQIRRSGSVIKSERKY